jgi:hypothetical protein
MKFRLNPMLGIQPSWLSLLMPKNQVTMGKSIRVPSDSPWK